MGSLCRTCKHYLRLSYLGGNIEKTARDCLVSDKFNIEFSDKDTIGDPLVFDCTQYSILTKKLSANIPEKTE